VVVTFEHMEHEEIDEEIDEDEIDDDEICCLVPRG
jgi:hypothetical protein